MKIPKTNFQFIEQIATKCFCFFRHRRRTNEIRISGHQHGMLAFNFQGWHTKLNNVFKSFNIYCSMAFHFNVRRKFSTPKECKAARHQIVIFFCYINTCFFSFVRAEKKYLPEPAINLWAVREREKKASLNLFKVYALGDHSVLSVQIPLGTVEGYYLEQCHQMLNAVCKIAACIEFENTT